MLHDKIKEILYLKQGRRCRRIKKGHLRMKKKIKILRVSNGSFIITVILTILFFVIAICGNREFHILKQATDKYIVCEEAAKQLQDGSDYLTEQVRLYVMTGDQKYMDLYFKEAKETKRREKSLAKLKKYFDKTAMFTSLQKALYCSNQLMNTEYYAMRLVIEANGVKETIWPKEIKNVSLTDKDMALSIKKKQARAQELVCGKNYQERRNEITNEVTRCMKGLIKKTKNRQGRAVTIFSDMYLKLELGIVILAILMLAMCILIRKLIVIPLVSYNESIKKGEIFPVIGAEELQNLAETYNHVYKENQETQRLIRHQAEHDAMTQLLNRGSFEKLLKIYEEGDSSYALILVDVDTFKSVNDTYGHDMGDQILKKVADNLKKTFRSIDYVCRIGGDEFAIIMVEMTSDLAYTIKDKIEVINQRLGKEEDGLPAVSLSVGVAFADREDPGDSIFKDADMALYDVKEHGRCGCRVYEG